MQIKISPIRGLPGQPETTLFVAGDVLTYDGVVCDLSPVPEGGEATDGQADSPFIGPITRVNGDIHCTLLVVLGDDAANDQPTNPAIWTLDVADGAVVIPVVRKPEPIVEPIV